MEHPFDNLTKKLAKRGLTRRESLRWMGGGFFGAVLASLGMGKLFAHGAAADNCTDYCRSLGLTPGKGNAWGKCVSNCANCRDAGGRACGAGSCCFDDEVCCPEGSPGATCVSCGEGEELDPATCTCVAVCCQGPGGVCGSFETCGSSGPLGSCLCFSRLDGSGACGQDDFCSNLQSCSSDSDCPSGTFCSPNTCCSGSVCLAFCDCDTGSVSSKTGSSAKQVAPTITGSGPTAGGHDLNLR